MRLGGGRAEGGKIARCSSIYPDPGALRPRVERFAGIAEPFGLGRTHNARVDEGRREIGDEGECAVARDYDRDGVGAHEVDEFGRPETAVANFNRVTDGKAVDRRRQKLQEGGEVVRSQIALSPRTAS